MTRLAPSSSGQNIRQFYPLSPAELEVPAVPWLQLQPAAESKSGAREKAGSSLEAMPAWSSEAVKATAEFTEYLAPTVSPAEAASASLAWTASAAYATPVLAQTLQEVPEGIAGKGPAAAEPASTGSVEVRNRTGAARLARAGRRTGPPEVRFPAAWQSQIAVGPGPEAAVVAAVGQASKNPKRVGQEYPYWAVALFQILVGTLIVILFLKFSGLVRGIMEEPQQPPISTNQLSRQAETAMRWRLDPAIDGKLPVAMPTPRLEDRTLVR